MRACRFCATNLDRLKRFMLKISKSRMSQNRSLGRVSVVVVSIHRVCYTHIADHQKPRFKLYLSKGTSFIVPADYGSVHWAYYGVCYKQIFFRKNLQHKFPLPTAPYSRHAAHMPKNFKIILN